MSTTRAQISVAEYLHTVYEVDCDYVDGEVVERNMGDRDHAWLQTALGAYFFAHRKEWNIATLTEMRVRVAPTRFRVPDLCIVLGDTDEKILTKPPFLCVEILSPDDRWSGVEGRINDFLAMGARYVWVIDPETAQICVATLQDGLREVKDGVLRTENPAFQLPLSELYS